jgi:exonuclease SbcC
MKIDSIHLKNIRSHKDTTLALERLTCIKGMNHAGKSSVVAALEFALARRSDVTDGAKERQQTDLLRFGEDQGLIELAIDDAGIPIELRASLTKRSGLNITLRNPADKEWSPVEFKRMLDDDSEVLSCLCNNLYFVSAKPQEQKAILAAILVPAHYEWPEWVKTDLHQARIALNWAQGQFDLIESGYDLSFKARTDVNRRIKEWRPPQTNGEYSGPPVDEIKAKLEQRRKERTDAAVKQRDMKAAIDQAVAAKANHVRRAEEARARIETERKERETVAGNALSDAAVKKLTKEAAGAKKVEDLDSTILTFNTLLGTLKEHIAAVGALEMVSECPTCHQAITDEAFAAIFTPLKENQDKILSQQKEAYDARKALGDPAGAQKKLDAHKAVEDDLKRIDKRIADHERTIAAAEKEANAIDPLNLPKPESLDEEIKNLEERITFGTQCLQDAARADALKDDAAKAHAAKKAMDEELARLERLVAYFGPKGIKAELIAQHIGSFQNSVNAILEKWGYECELQIEPYGFLVKRLGSPFGTQLHMLSRSEKLRFADAFTVALAMVSGWRIGVFDDSETIVGGDRKMLKGMLLESGLDQAIVLEADTSTPSPAIPGTVFIEFRETLEGGISTTSVQVLASTPKG